jgi:phosphatidylglycerol---prolipoprotein diacylglyceryl transferase
MDPIALQLGPIKVHRYDIMYLLGLAVAWLLARRRAANHRSP